MAVQLKKNPPRSATAITVVDKVGYQALFEQLPAATRRWLDTVGFNGAANSHALLPDAEGQLQQVFAGVAHALDPFALAALPMALPEGHYTLDSGGLALPPELAALSWEVGGYAFDRYKPRSARRRS